MNIKVVTTCNRKGWNTYGAKMVETFRKHWSENIELVLYNEDFAPPDGVTARPFPAWHKAFKNRHQDNPAAHGNDRSVNRRGRVHDYRYDCVRFSHKVAAITDTALRTHAGLLIWIDADTLTHADVTEDWLYDLFPSKPVQPGAFQDLPYNAWLERERKYPECGFMMFRCDHPGHSFFMSRLADLYKTDEVFTYDETHDSYVIEQLIKFFHDRNVIGKPFDLSGPRARRSSHPFVLSRLGEKLDHLKGNIKHKEKKSPKQYSQGRTEDYWK